MAGWAKDFVGGGDTVFVQPLKKTLDLKKQGGSFIYQPERAGQLFVLQAVVLYCTAAKSVTKPASISIGTSAPAYNDVMPPVVLSGFGETGNIITIPMTKITKGISAAQKIYINVSDAASGELQEADAYITGIFVDA
jgi:hypothetical protein